MDIKQAIVNYQPYNEQERIDKELLLEYIETYEDLYTRSNEKLILPHPLGSLIKKPNQSFNGLPPYLSILVLARWSCGWGYQFF